MRKNIFLPVILLFYLFSMFGLSSCIKEELAGSRSADAKTVTLHVTLPEPIVKSPMSRVGAVDFNAVRDINVVIADGSNDESKIYETYFYNGSSGETADPSVNWGDGSDMTIHFSETFTEQHGLNRKKFYIVANYGSKIEKSEVSDVGALKSLKQESQDFPGIPVNGCMMFAEALNSGSHTHDDTGQTGISLSAALQRTVAMITVAIDGADLNEGVSVIPRKISLHRVPETGYIGKTNKPYEDRNVAIVPDGESKGGSGELNWPMIVGTKTFGNPVHASWASAAETTAGGHYPGEGESLDFSSQDIAPLFMFENDHGGDSFGHPSGDGDQRIKRPAGCRTTEWGQILADESTATCSYLDVEAYYVRMNAEGTHSLYSGTVHFRFFLGEDATKNFDVLRNHYYKITLDLNGYAVTEGGQVNADGELEVNEDEVTWRVESDLGVATFETGDVILNASGEYFPIDITASEGVTITVKGNLQQQAFLWIYNGAGGNLWTSVAEGVTATATKDNAGKIKVWLYAQPWSPGTDFLFDEENNTARKHTVTLEVRRNGSSEVETSTIEVVQYKPIEYTATGDYIEQIFGKEEVTLYIDRIDREAMPWGFYGEVLSHNSDDAFHNTYHLIDPDPSKEDPTHTHTHREVSKQYLPWGKMNGGSAMIYAITFWNMPQTNPSGNINDMINNPVFPDIEENDNIYYGNDFYWTLPTVLGWQIVEKASIAGALDANHPILPYLQYWSSNAVTKETEGDEGKERAYTYQFGRNLHSLQQGDAYPSDLKNDRRNSLRFRLVAVRASVDNPYH